MNFAIGTKYEDCVEITKQDYDDLIKKINNTKKAMTSFSRLFLL